MNDATRKYVDEMNALALSQSMNDLRGRLAEYERRLQILDNEVAKLQDLVKKQTTVVGNALRAVMGRGSTVKE